MIRQGSTNELPMGFVCQENYEQSVLLPLNMTSCQMSVKV